MLYVRPFLLEIDVLTDIQGPKQSPDLLLPSCKITSYKPPLPNSKSSNPTKLRVVSQPANAASPKPKVQLSSLPMISPTAAWKLRMTSVPRMNLSAPSPGYSLPNPKSTKTLRGARPGKQSKNLIMNLSKMYISG